MKLEDIVREETDGGSFPELGVKIPMTKLVKLATHYISKFEEEMAGEDDETKLIILQSKYNLIHDMFGEYI